jgi:hypothetical protein
VFLRESRRRGNVSVDQTNSRRASVPQRPVASNNNEDMEQEGIEAAVRAKLTKMILSLTAASRKAGSPAEEREILLELRAVTITLDVVEPITRFGQFPEFEALDVSRTELGELLAGYRANHGRPDEKRYLAKIQNCGLRMAILDREANFFKMFGDLQADEQIKLFLM